MAWGSPSARKCATPLVSLWTRAPPSPSRSISSCVTVFTTFGPGHEHVAAAVDHHGEVGDRRRIDGATGARPHHHRDLWHDARCQRVAQEDLRVAPERCDPLLDSRAARIRQADDRRAGAHRQVHHLADLLGVRLGQRSAEDGEVLRVDEDQPPVDAAVPADDAIAEVRSSSSPKSVARCVTNASSSTKDPSSSSSSIRSRAVQLVALVLLRNPLLSPAEACLFAHAAEDSRACRPSTRGRPPRWWWAQQGSNLRPAGYEPDALTTELWARQMVDKSEYRGSSLHKDVDIPAACG